ncbi:high nitrogen upregulated cytochrome P450 monooxygenase 2 [Lactarius akahatsu]|uniref:High nitrogen upregulated cytochrome P450 monooxygenase 2 n=1 Tax=Lactarius akahatsu TaxID=416441 RepID=A0AAD4QCY3_9AGAM|nr:high nitrogen upregulated cytochrome P450 monooxygenase 2 [Lactarius akahatsu]
MSALDTGIFVLFISFASHQCFRYFEARSKLPLVILLFVVPALLSVPISYHAPWPPAAILLAFVAYGSAVASFALMYRLSPFHPLAKFPGPAIAKTSKLWAAYHGATGDQHRCYKSLHDRYGDVVRVGPNELSIRDPLLVHPLLGQGGLPKGPGYGGLDGPPMLISQCDPILHMHQRKPWSSAFSSTAMKEYEITVAKRIRQLVGCLEAMVQRSDQKASAVVDMTKWLKYFATDFMGDMAFGGGFELMKAGRDTDGLWTLLESSLWTSAPLSHIPYVLPPLMKIMGDRSAIGRFREFCRERVLERLRMGANRKDLFYYLSGEEMPDSKRPSPATVAEDGMLAIIAGSDTTSSVLTAVFYYLLRNPLAYERLQAEVDGAFPSGEEPLDVTTLSQMEWLNSCINETLRLQPPVPSGSQRTVGKGKGAKVLENLIIPEETQLSLHTYSIHRDPRNFHTPDAFLPERWLSTGAPAGEHNPAAFFPFSYGPTICAGKNLASMEMRMLLCWVLRRFRFSKPPGVTHEEWEGRILDWFVVHQDPLLVNFSLRE